VGLVYMNARWYEPESGRFMSVDPLIDLRSPQGHNSYSYVVNNPANLADPTGEFCTPILGTCFGSTVSLTQGFASLSHGVGHLGAGNDRPQALTHTERRSVEGVDQAVDRGAGSQNGGAPASDIGGDPWDGVEEFPVSGSRPSHGPFQLNQLFAGVPQFTAYPDSYANFMAAQGRMDAMIASMAVSMNSRPPTRNSRSSNAHHDTMVRNAAAASFLAPSSTTMALSGAAFLGIGLYALGAGLAVLGTGGLAVIPLGFYGASVTASAGGAAVLGTGFATIGFANVFTASVMRRQGH
jgi:hypothetical protein